MGDGVQRSPWRRITVCAMNNVIPPPGSDPIYKRFYAFARMVEDLLRTLFTPAELDADYDTLEKLSTEYVGDASQRRHGDTAWRLRTGGADDWLHVLVMLEFQSTTDSAMALRVLEYTALLYRELLRNGKAELGALPPVLPIVLYNGDAPWTPADEMRDLIAKPPPALARYQPSQGYFLLDQRHAPAEDFKLRELTWAVAQLERSRTADDLAPVVRRLAALLASPSEFELRRTFSDWLWAMRQPLVGGDPAQRPPKDLNLEDTTMSLVDRIAEWPKQYIEQGREEGMAHERQLLRRMAATRFDSATAERLAAAIATETDPQRLMAVGVAIARCATGSELLREIGSRR